MIAHQAASSLRSKVPMGPAAAKSAGHPDRRPQAATICVVDDDEAVRDSLSVLLESLGFEVVTRGSGREFLADDRCRHAGCLIVDHNMPGMDGLTTVAALQRDGVAVPTILITGRLDPEIVTRAEQLGVNAILEKPFPATRLLELLRANMRPE
jgi:two-component system, LuxR family, response regulator FixJ